MKSADLLILASLVFSSVCFAQSADSIAASAARSLRSAPYKNVRVSVNGNAVTLTGNVALYLTREDAEDQVRHLRGIGMVRNEIQVDTPAVPDRKLQTNVEIAITARIGPLLHSVVNPSDLISVHVHGGVVLLEGNLPDRRVERAVFDAVAQTKGVREIIDRTQLSNGKPVPVWPPNSEAGVSRTF